VSADETAGQQLLDLMSGLWKTQALHVAADLGVIDAIGSTDRPSSIALADRLGLNADAVGRLLSYLERLGVVAGSEPEGYRLTDVGALLRTDDAGTVRDLLCLYGREFYRAWGALDHSMRTGDSAFSWVFGAGLFEFLAAHPDRLATYERGMEAGTPFFDAVSDAYDLTDAVLIVDVAGGSGALLDQILSRNPGPSAILFDAPPVIARTGTSPIATRHGPRCERVAGDFFRSVPGGGDVYILSRILHCFDDDSCRRILTNCHRAMQPDGRLIVLERIVGADEKSSLTEGYSMHMLVVLGGGRERTEEQYASLLLESGFVVESVTALPLETNLIVTRPVGPAHPSG
jgi:SAM-dependent methyltransferase